MINDGAFLVSRAGRWIHSWAAPKHHTPASSPHQGTTQWLGGALGRLVHLLCIMCQPAGADKWQVVVGGPGLRGRGADKEATRVLLHVESCSKFGLPACWNVAPARAM